MNERIVQVPHRESHGMAGGETNSTTGGSDAPLTERRFATNAVHAGTQHVGDAVNTPIFQSSTYKRPTNGMQDGRLALSTPCCIPAFPRSTATPLHRNFARWKAARTPKFSRAEWAPFRRCSSVC